MALSTGGAVSLYINGGIKCTSTSNHNTAVLQYDKSGNFIAEYKSAREAWKQTGISDTTIGLVCKGKGKTAGGTIVLHYMPHELIGNYFTEVNV